MNRMEQMSVELMKRKPQRELHSKLTDFQSDCLLINGFKISMRINVSPES